MAKTAVYIQRGEALDYQNTTEDLIPAGIPSGMQLSGHGHLFEQLHGKNPFIQLEKLEKYGLGTQEYELQTVR